jgi:hypothetical protein
MNNIDMTRLVSADDKAAAAQADLLAARKAECRARILAVADSTVQINLAAAAAAGLLKGRQMTAYRASLGWIADMRAACATGDWPDVPPGVTRLAAKY